MNTPKFTLTKDEKMTNRFMGSKVSKKTKFMNEDIDIHKLTVAQVLGIQEKAKEITDEANEKENIGILLYVIRAGTPELKDLSDDEICALPMDELTNLSNEILKYSGLVNQKK